MGSSIDRQAREMVQSLGKRSLKLEQHKLPPSKVDLSVTLYASSNGLGIAEYCKWRLQQRRQQQQ
jgi:hypothetical protein